MGSPTIANLARPSWPTCVLLGMTAALIGLAPQAAASNWNVALHSGSSGESRSQAKPSAPTGVTATCTSSSAATVKVAWSSVAHATSYSLYESTTSASSGYSVVATNVTTTTW